MLKRGFDFSRDYEVLNELGSTIFERAKQLRGPDQKTEREALLRAAAETFEKTLALDTENVAAHYNLQLIYTQLNEPERSAEHGRMHARYKLDDNARDRAIALARQKYPAANHAAEALVIYPLQRPGAPGLALEGRERPIPVARQAGEP